MKALLAVSAAVLVALLGPVPTAWGEQSGGGAENTPAPSPSYVDHTEWTRWLGMPSLRVFPTAFGRATSRLPGTESSADEAWAEVLAQSPDADAAGMREQFICHWHYAELAQPGKVSWNLEPWRPVVDEDELVASGCNPGGPEEAF
jgi:hypothetical protein